jgi:hypothetical protein
MNGKHYFVSVMDTVISFLAYIAVFLTFVSLLDTLGKITG